LVLVTVLFSGPLRFSGAWPRAAGRRATHDRSAHLIVVWPATVPPAVAGMISH